MAYKWHDFAVLPYIVDLTFDATGATKCVCRGRELSTLLTVATVAGYMI